MSTTKEEKNFYMLFYWLAFPEKRLAAVRKWRGANPEAARRANRVSHRKHILNAPADNPPLGAACEICYGKDEPLFMDHCHAKSVFRGWLCRSCNLMLGYAKDQPTLLRAGIRYLGKK